MQVDNSQTRQARYEMVETQIRKRGIIDSRILRAFQMVPRHVFVPAGQRSTAYRDYPLPIGAGQTISQPYIVALMTAILSPSSTDRVLEIGTGSGYQTAILAELAKEVFTIERIRQLTESAGTILQELGYKNIHLFNGDGSKGIPEQAPFERIMVTACSSRLYPAWFEQLQEGGKIVLPLGDSNHQELIEGRKMGGKIQTITHGSVVFVPLVQDE